LLQELPKCETDAIQMKNILEKKSFSVELKLNVKRSEMIFAVREFSESLSKGDLALFYFSGHGISYDDFHCLLPNNYKGDESNIKEFSVTFNNLNDRINKNHPAHKIFLFDCCNRPFKNGDKPTNFSEINISKYGTNVLIASSTTESTLASVNEKNGMSLWTSYLVEELNKEERNIERCLKNVRENMRSDGHQQIPWETHSLDGDLFI